MQLESIIDVKEDTQLKLKAELNKLLDFNRPKNLDTRKKDNAITELEKNYQKALLAFSENGIDGKGFSVFEFRTTMEYFEQRNAEMKQKTDNIKSKQHAS